MCSKLRSIAELILSLFDQLVCENGMLQPFSMKTEKKAGENFAISGKRSLASGLNTECAFM